MNKRFIALSAACMTAASIVSCSDSNKKSGKISDVASAINDTISREYNGIIASDARYSLNDSETIGYRSQIRKSSSFDDEWILIANKGKMQLFYAKDWDDTAKGYKKAENDGDLTLAEIYKKYISNFKSDDEDDDNDDDNDDDGGMIGYIEKSKRSSANANAKTMRIAIESALADADAVGYDVQNIGYIVFESGGITDINYGGSSVDEISELIEEYANNYFGDLKELPYVVAFCSHGSVNEVYWGQKSSAEISGCYPVDEECYGLTFDDILEEKCGEYFVEPTKPSKPPVQGSSGGLGKIRLKTGGDKFVIAGWSEPDVENLIQNWCDVSGYDENKVSFLNLKCGGGGAPEKYDNYFASGEEIDLYFVEADWAHKYINNDSLSVPLEDLGFSENNFMDCYSYTIEVGKATVGANSGKMVGASWQACPGAFAYRSDLAEQYLGVKTPEEMQEKIGDWDKFKDSALKISEASEGKVALADSVEGMFHAYSQSMTIPWVVDNRINFDSSCEDFADKAKQLWEKGGVSHVSQWSEYWLEKGTEGSTMGYFVSTWGTGESILGQASSKTYGKWNLVQGPSPYFWGGTWMVAKPESDNGEELQSFIYTSCADPDAMLGYAYQTGEFVNSMTAMQGICDSGYGSDFAMGNFDGQNYMKAFDANARAIDNKGLITPYDADIKTAFIDALRKSYLEGSGSYADVLNEVSEKFK